jgi:hypothetical protein
MGRRRILNRSSAAAFAGRDATSTYTTTYSAFDTFGNAQTVSEDGNVSRTRTKTFFTSTSEWMAGLPKNETIGSARTIVRNYARKEICKMRRT